MTINEINEIASIIIGKNIDISLAKTIVNECILNLSALYFTACPIKCLTIVSKDTLERYCLPSNSGIARVISKKQECFDYSVNEIGISFQDAGEYNVYYYEMDNTVSDTETEVPINKRYHLEICKYLAFSILMINDPNSNVSDKLIDEYYKNIKSIDRSLKNNKRKNSAIQARRWR